MLRSPSRPLQSARTLFRGIRLPETSVLRQLHALWLHGWLIGWRCALCIGAGCAVYLLLRQRRPAEAPDPVTDLLDAATDASAHSAGGGALAASGEGGDFAGGAAEKGARRR